MVKKFTTNCDFGAQKTPVTLYVGDPAIGNHPLAFQNKWLSTSKGGNVPANIMEAFDELRNISETSRVPFEDLCAYVVDELNSRKALKGQVDQATALANPKPPKQPQNVQAPENAQVQAAKPQAAIPQKQAVNAQMPSPPRTPFFRQPVPASPSNNLPDENDQK